jgi:hypothetical protein
MTYWLFISKVALIAASFSTYIAVTNGVSDVLGKGHADWSVWLILAHSCLWLAWRAYALERLVLEAEQENGWKR